MELEAVVEEEPRNLFQKIIVVFMVLTTLIGTGVSYLQHQATIEQNRSTRQAQALAVGLMGEIIRSGQLTAHDFWVFSEYLNNQQLSLVKQGAALELGGADQGNMALRYQDEAEKYSAVADQLKKYTVLLSDPRYAPAEAQGVPDLKLYADDAGRQAGVMLKEQNAAADAIQHWSDKGNVYVSVITLLAVALFLFGLSLTIGSRVKYLFMLVGLSIDVVGVIWTAVTFIQ
jgi:hypothetical protein